MIDPLQGVIPFPGQVATYHPGYRTGRYYFPFPQGAPNFATSFAANIAYFCPFVVHQTHLFTGMAIDVGTIGTANNARMAVYGSVAGIPGNLIIDGGVAVGANPLQTTGMKPTAALNLALSPGCYWTSVVMDGAATLGGATNSQSPMFLVGVATEFTAAADTSIQGVMNFGAFPAQAFTGAMGAISFNALASPAVGLLA